MKTDKVKYLDSIDNNNVKISYIEAKEINSMNNSKIIDMTENIEVVKKDKVKEIVVDNATKTYVTAKDNFPFLDNRINITNVYKEIGKQSIPLFYKYKLSQPVKREVTLTNQFYIYNNITDEKAKNGDIVYELVYIKRDDEMYDLYFFMNNVRDLYKMFYVLYKDYTGKTIKEYIFPEFAYYPRHYNYLNGSDLNPFEYTVRSVGNYHEIKIETPIDKNKFHIDMVGYHKVKPEPMVLQKQDDKWSVNIKSGIFEVDNISKNRMKFQYILKEYDQELFDTYGPPYKRVTEKPTVIDNKIMLKNKLVYDKKEIMITINDKEVMYRKDFDSIDKINGIIEIPKNFSKHDKVEIEYTAIVENIEYDGFYDMNSREKLEFNLNPTKGNKLSYIDKKGKKKEMSVFQLMKKPVYIYLKPTFAFYCDKMVNDERIRYETSTEIVEVTDDVSYTRVKLNTQALTNGFCELITSLDNLTVQRGSNENIVSDKPFWTFDNEAIVSNNYIRIYNSHLLKGQRVLLTYLSSDELRLVNINKDYTIFHTIERYTDEECEKDGLLLLAECFCFPSQTIDDLKVYDIRSRGGGVTDKLPDDLREIIEPDSRFYWDIGFWDGEETGGKILTFRINPELLVENGGHLTEGIIKESIEKHIDAGADYIIEYVKIEEHMEV